MHRIVALAFVSLVSIVMPAALTRARADQAPVALDGLAILAGSSDASAARLAIARLRQAGPAGVAALGRRLDELTQTRSTISDESELRRFEEHRQRLSAALDAVGAQRDCAASRLYWHTDFEAAKSAACREQKPILSLRMLGNLTDELSCANSRFFRMALYANATVSKALRERFVLHWQSVRPVPTVTIDFGDGRKLLRTVTGNSIHYLLDSDGRPIDALPGLYGPMAFLKGLDQADAVLRSLQGLSEKDRLARLRQYHGDRVAGILQAWDADLQRVAVPAAADSTAGLPAADASTAGLLTSQTLSRRECSAPSPTRTAAELERATDEGEWERIAALHGEEARLDRASIALMRRQNPNAAQAGRLAITKRAVEDPLLRLVANFQRSVALDTVHNEYQFRRRIHEWFAADSASDHLDALNERVYAELFLTPSSDPWLGLAAPNVYTGLTNDGIIETAAK